MNKVANVVFAYVPKNDDELELKVGDKIEVIGFEEEGWWKGQLRGRIGVFPSNFVQVVDTPGLQSAIASSVTQSATANKLNSIFGAKAKTPISQSSTSLSSNNSTSCGAINNINSNSNSNLTMNNNNNTPIAQSQQQGLVGSAGTNANSSEDPNFGERRPKPIKGIGYGDIFASGGAKLKPLPVDPGGVKPPLISANGRSNAGLGTSSSQKQIPKKPPPPTPISNDNLNGSSSSASSEQAPALPPKPSNQFSPHIHSQTRPSLPPVQSVHPHQHHMNSLQQQPIRERARVVYAYEPLNDDELAMRVGDIIDIIDKEIEDAGWWKGELRGKIGVFPDNFVELIEPSEHPPAVRSDWQHQSLGNANTVAGPQNSPPKYYNSNTENNNKIKSVFSATPKGFSKELESNLEKHGSTPASFLSLKRNKLNQQHTEDTDQQQTTQVSNEKADDGIGSLGTKLNHITANRAKGPTRRPPSNILNKRNQFDTLKKELTNGNESGNPQRVAEKGTPQNNPDIITSSSLNNNGLQSSVAKNDSSTSSSSQQQQHATPSSMLLNRPSDKAASGKPSLSLDDAIDNNEQLNGGTNNQAPQTGSIPGLPASVTTPNTPKTSQRFSQQQQDKANTASSTTPPWMVEWKKTHAEKKRDTPLVGEPEDSKITTAPIDTTSANASSSNNSTPPATTATVDFPPNERKTSVHSLREPYNPAATKGMNSRFSVDCSTPVSTYGPTETVSSNNRFNAQNIAQESTNNFADSPATANKPNSSLNRGPRSEITNSALQTPPPGKGSDTHVTVTAAATTTGNSTTNNNKFLNSRSRFESSVDASHSAANNQQQVGLNTNQRPNNDTKSANIGDNNVDAALSLKDELGSSIKSHYDKLFQQISDRVDNEISELRSEVAMLRKELDGMDELKRVLGVMKQELKACQSATDNQRKYIKELVGNLADERKKIAAMQIELDRNLK